MQPDLENTKKKIQENRDLIDRIMLKLPGFQGYVEKAELYQADKIVRDLLVDRIQAYKNDLNSLSKELVKDGIQDILSDIEDLNLNFERVQKKCKSAEFGSNASLSNVKLTEADHNRLLEYDWRMISNLDDFDKIVSDLNGPDKPDRSALIKQLAGKLKDFEKSFDERKNVLLEVI